jgi:hypothetical protein
MASRIAASVSRAVRRIVPLRRQAVHFHVDPAGRAYVCDYARCESPGITHNDVAILGR